MASRKQEEALPEAPQEPLEEGVALADEASNWEFIDRVPSRIEVMELLMKLPEVWGVKMAKFADYVQALPQKKKVQKPHPTRAGTTVAENVDCFTLYVSVAGRQQMLRDAQENHGWRVDYRPEPVTPTGIPGYLSFSGRLVYRVYVDIYARSEEVVSTKVGDVYRDGHEWRLLGTRSGTAWVPESNGKNAAGSNPYEKVETSALGRALGAWGFGVLPGSGIATVEEMAAIAGNRKAIAEEASSEPGEQEQRRESREDILQSLMAVMEEYRQESGMDEIGMTLKAAAYLSDQLAVPGVYDSVKKKIEWASVKDGQLVIMRNAMRASLVKLRSEQPWGA